MNLPTISTVVLVAHWLIIVGLSIRVITRRPPVGVSAAWLAVIFSVPFVGAGIYLLFGEKRLGRHRAARIVASLGRVEQWKADLRQRNPVAAGQVGTEAEPLHQLAMRILGFPAMPGNTIELHDNFQSVFDAMVADIDMARQKVHACFYIWHEGGRMGEIVDALIRASQRGVHCRALADAAGSKAFLASAWATRLRTADVEVSAAMPTGLLRAFFARADLRNHRKIMVIDERIAYTGSLNLVDPRFFKQESGVGEWVDAMARVTGPAAGALDGVFALDWAVENARPFEPPMTDVKGANSETGTVVQIVPSGPDLTPAAIHQLLLTAIYAARRELVMTTPYFVPDESILTALLSAALRGVSVTLVVPARNDSMLVRYASVAAFDDLLSAGAHIALFEGGLLHTKSLTIDGEVSIFGSVNLDMRSIELNFEISMFVYDRDFTSRLRALQFRYLEDSEWLSLESWRKRPAWHRFAEDSFRLLGPLL